MEEIYLIMIYFYTDIVVYLHGVINSHPCNIKSLIFYYILSALHIFDASIESRVCW